MGIDQNTIFVKISSHNGCKQNRMCTFILNFFNVSYQVLTVSRVWICKSFRIVDFSIIVSKLNENIIAFLYFFQHWFPMPFLSKAFTTSTIDSMIFYRYIFFEEWQKHLNPTSFWIFVRIGFVCHGRITNGIYFYGVNFIICGFSTPKL